MAKHTAQKRRLKARFAGIGVASAATMVGGVATANEAKAAGGTIWGREGGWQALYQANTSIVKNPDLIYVGRCATCRRELTRSTGILPFPHLGAK